MRDEGDLSGLPDAAVAAATAFLGPSVLPARTVGSGSLTFKYVVKTTRGDAVVRFYAYDDPPAVDYEADVIARLAEAGVAVPDILGDSRAGPPADRPYVVYRFVPGRTYRADSGAQSRDVARNVADELMKLWSVPVGGFGDLLSATDARSADWRAFLRTSFGGGLSIASAQGSAPVDVLEAIASVADRIDAFPPPSRANICWGDVKDEHVILGAHDRVAALIDFEGALGGEPALDLGYCFAMYGPGPFYVQLDAAVEARLGPISRNRVLLYAVLRAARLLRYLHLPRPTGAPRDPLSRILPGLQPALRELTGATTT